MGDKKISLPQILLKWQKNMPDRIEIMDAHNLPYDRRAESVIITGCQITCKYYDAA